jgi:hypothetical protein
MRSAPRLLVRRIIGREWRLTTVVPRGPAAVKKDFYVLVPHDPRLSLAAYAALLHARPVAAAIAARDSAAKKGDFAQLTLEALREVRVPLLDTRARAWLEECACEGAAIGRALLRSASPVNIDADPAWRDLRERLDRFAGTWC